MVEGKKQSIPLYVPISVLEDTTVSVLEAIVEYLKEAKGLRYREIAKLLNRDERNIWTVYKRAKVKRNNALRIRPSKTRSQDSSRTI